MARYKKNHPSFFSLVFFFLIIYVCSVIFNATSNNNDDGSNGRSDGIFRIIASNSTKEMYNDLTKFAKKNKIKLEVEYYGDLEIVDVLNESIKDYDAVWISNSIWLYMLNNNSVITDSKSIAINPVVMGITLSKANELGLTNEEIYNKDLLKLIREDKLKYVMASVTKTNTGATSYLSFLNSLAGSPEILTEKMLDNESLKKDLKDLFKGVERVSGDEEYLVKMFENGSYDAMINYESSLINLNKERTKKGKEPLYLVYPIDGVAINDMPFAYINNDSSDTKRKEIFNKIQSYLRSDDAIKLMESYGYRSWYGGINKDADKSVFNPSWGIDTSKYLKDMKYPSKAVITKALNMYIDTLRKPTHVVFCLDVSGSMYGDGLEELQEAMDYILDYESASVNSLQFSNSDKITVITFNHDVKRVMNTRTGNNTKSLIDEINDLSAIGGTNIYSPTIKALKILSEESDDYTKTVILMTDGYSNSGSYEELDKYYKTSGSQIPIYSITFGESSDYQLEKLAELSNGKVFDGKSGLLRAFKEVRSYN